MFTSNPTFHSPLHISSTPVGSHGFPGTWVLIFQHFFLSQPIRGHLVNMTTQGQILAMWCVTQSKLQTLLLTALYMEKRKREHIPTVQVDVLPRTRQETFCGIILSLLQLSSWAAMPD